MELLVKEGPFNLGYAKVGDAGLDLYADLPEGEELTLDWGDQVNVPTQAVAVPIGYVGQVWPRSGLSFKHGVLVGGGIVDEGYRGQIYVIMIKASNHGAPLIVRRGDRIGQLVLLPVATCNVKMVAELPVSARGEAGLGSTGR